MSPTRELSINERERDVQASRMLVVWHSKELCDSSSEVKARESDLKANQDCGIARSQRRALDALLHA
eukprot:3398129-Amphidinium_carterae.1